MLIGDTFFDEKDWPSALDQYLRAEKLLRPNQAREQVQLSIRLGKTYRRLPAPPGGVNNNLALAVAKLETALNANPGNTELTVELGSAYIDGKQDAKAIALTQKIIASAEFAKAPADERSDVYVIAGKALYNTKKLKESSDSFDDAAKLKPNDITIKKYRVTVINEQAFAAGGDYKAASALLNEALKIDAENPLTLTNVAVLTIERGQCKEAEKQLIKLDQIRPRRRDHPASARPCIPLHGQARPPQGDARVRRSGERGEEDELAALARRDLHRVGSAVLGQRYQRRRR